MQKIQQEIEKISELNSGLEQEFESELDKKNKNSTEVGQIISSVNNIYKIVKQLAEKKGKMTVVMGEEVKDDVTFEENVASSKQKSVSQSIKTMQLRLDLGQEYIADLVEVFKRLKASSKLQQQAEMKKIAEENKLAKQK